MNHLTIEAYEFFKAQYPDYLLLFLVGNYYEAYGTDSLTISNLLGVRQKDLIVQIPANNILDVVGRLSLMGFPSKVLVSRNATGERDVPDVSRIKLERSEDF